VTTSSDQQAANVAAFHAGAYDGRHSPEDDAAFLQRMTARAEGWKPRMSTDVVIADLCRLIELAGANPLPLPAHSPREQSEARPSDPRP
jgi:hypothetical protein